MATPEPAVPPRVLYVAGPMRGVPEFNFPAFRAATAYYRARGWAVIDPSEGWGGETDLPWSTYMRHDLSMLLASVHAIALLPGWERSEGASLERRVGEAIGLPVFLVPAEALAEALPEGS